MINKAKLATLRARRAELEARFDSGEMSENILFWLAEIDRKILSVIMGR